MRPHKRSFGWTLNETQEENGPLQSTESTNLVQWVPTNVTVNPLLVSSSARPNALLSGFDAYSSHETYLNNQYPNEDTSLSLPSNILDPTYQQSPSHSGITHHISHASILGRDIPHQVAYVMHEGSQGRGLEDTKGHIQAIVSVAHSTKPIMPTEEAAFSITSSQSSFLCNGFTDWNSEEFDADPLQSWPGSHSHYPSKDIGFSTESPQQHRTPRKHTTKEEANFRCGFEGCGKFFSRSYNYKSHMETHDERREYPFPCSVKDCNKKFVRKTDLQRHHQSVHMRERNHQCDFCGRLFARKDTLRRHMDDGCSKRFDIGTMDLISTEYYNSSVRPDMSLPE